MLFLKGQQYKNTWLRSLQNETQNEKQGIYIQTMPLADLNHSHRFTYLNASKAQKVSNVSNTVYSQIQLLQKNTSFSKIIF